ncbi:MAG: hypothetical protein FWF02_14605 [Micrococcales bacterium]|nr:hypothetical protein [Micrococcales bacterium]MCL2668909.1 hypothetical protein [Micrococcales bacterium]
MERRTRRRIVTVALAGAAAFALSSCMKMEVDIDIKSEEDIRTLMVFGMERTAAEQMSDSGQEMTPESLCAQTDTQVPLGSGDADVIDVSDDTYIACRVSGTATLADMSDRLTHADDKYTFVWISDNPDDDSGTMAATSSMFDSFRVSVTFPGKVLEHNGSSTVKGTTVTWTDPADMYGAEGLRAVGRDTSSSSGVPWLVFAGIGALALVVLAVVLALVLRGKGKKNPAAVQPYPQAPPQGPYPPQPQYPQQPQHPQAFTPAQGPPEQYQAPPPAQGPEAPQPPQVPAPPEGPEVPQPPSA